MDSEKFQLVLDLFKVLADETRLRIVGMVAEKACSVEELSERLELKPPTVSHHLQRLKEAGLVKMERDKNAHLYRLQTEQLHFLSKDILALEAVAAPEADDSRRWEDKVLKTYLINRKLDKIPATRKKREVILNWLIQHFEQGRKYPEKELNQIIRAYHEDTATLRRELIAAKLMQREQQIYWRTEKERC